MIKLYISILFFSSNNCEQDAVIISIINGCTSIYAATVIYSIIGFRATEQFDACVNGYVHGTLCQFIWVYQGKSHSCSQISSFRNIMMLLNAFDLTEGAVTESNYDEILQKLNSTISGSQVIQGLDLSTCNLRTFLSDVGLFLEAFFYSVNKPPECCGWFCTCFPGSGGNGSGFYRVHRSHHKDACFTHLVRPLLHHALLSRAFHHVWKCGGSRGSPAGSKDLSWEVA